MFRRDLERLGIHPTREELLDVLHTACKRGWNAGYHAGRRGSSLADARERGAA